MSSILIVDDEFDIAEVLSSILGADGHDVDVCANGRDAIAYMEGHPPPELVILDVMMPFVNGFEVLRFMRATEGLRKVPVILMSAVEPRVRQKDFGWNAFLRKPFELADLVSEVSRFLGSVERSA